MWSWRRDPGATSVGSNPAGYGGKKGRFPGEITYNPLNHCAGKVGMSWLYLSKPCAFYPLPLHTVLRVPPAPGRLRALCSKREQTKEQNPGESASREGFLLFEN